MNGESGSEVARNEALGPDCREATRDWDGRFFGTRFNVEQVPRLPTFPARWALEDPRERPYLVFWTTEGGSLCYPLRIQRIDGGKAVGVTKPSGASQPIEIMRRPSPSRTGTMILYRCPKCEKPRRYLYRLAPSGGRLVDCFGLQCQGCAGFRWASQGRYRNKAERRLFGSFATIYGNAFLPTLPRSPWDPRAISDPRMAVNEFPDDLLEAGRAGRDRHAALPDRAVELAEELGAAMASGDVARWLRAATAAPASSSLSGTPKGRGRAMNWQPTSDTDQRAIEAIQQTLSSMFARTTALLQGMTFLHRVLG